MQKITSEFKFWLCWFILPLLGLQGSIAQPWNYDFGTGTGVENTANTVSTTFLPVPGSGTARVRVGTGGGGFSLDNAGMPTFGTGTELNVTASSSTSVNKVSVYNYSGTSIAYTKFTTRLEAVTMQGGEASFFSGDGVNTFSGSTNFSGAEVFSGIRWVLSATTDDITVSYRNAGGWSLLGTQTKRVNYTFEIYGNNSAISSSYYRCGNTYSVAPNTQDIWVNDVLIGNDLSKALLASLGNIDSWCLNALSSTGNGLVVMLDDFMFSNSFPSLPEANINATNISCFGFNDGLANLTVLNAVMPLTFSWSNGDSIEDISGLSADTFSVTITEGNGCITTASTVITEPTNVSTQFGTNYTDVTCFGGSDGTASYPLQGGTLPYIYTWSTGDSTELVTGLSAGYYSLVESDANGCGQVQIDSIPINEPFPIIITPTSTPTGCYLGNDGTASVMASGGTPPYSYSWSNGFTSPVITNLTSGNYTITVTDYLNCSNTDTVFVGDATEIMAAETIMPPTCIGSSNGSININVNGGTGPYAFSWSSGPETEDISGLIDGEYCIDIIDANNCVKFYCYTVADPAPINIAPIINHVSCNGGSNGGVNVTITGGTAPYTANWFNMVGDSVGDGSEDLSNMPTGTYTIQVSDFNLCQDSDMFFIDQPPLPAIPGNRRTTDIQNSSVIARWNAVSGATSYRVRYRQAGTTTWSGYQSTTNLFRKITGLMASTSYEWSIRAFCGPTVYSGFSMPNSFTTIGMSCDQPLTPGVTDITDTSATLSWAAPGTGNSVDHYVMVITVDGTSWPVIPTWSDSALSVIVPLMSSTTFKWRVRSACDFSGNAASVWTDGPGFTTGGLKALSNSDLNLISEFSYYPNPANENLNVEIAKGTSLQKIAISDIQGKEIISKVPAGMDDKFIFDLKDFSEGIYLIKLITDSEVRTGKFNVVR